MILRLREGDGSDSRCGRGSVGTAGGTIFLRLGSTRSVDMGHSLARLAAMINWRLLEERFGAVYSDKPGQPPLPTKLMVGLSILKHTHNLSDEELRAPGREPAFDSLENRRFDCRYLANDLFEALSILTLQQRKRQSDERFVTARVVGEPPRRAGGRRDGLSTHRRRWCRSSSFPRICLSFGLSPGYPFRPKEKTRANSALSKPDRPPTSQVWRQSPDSQGVGPAALSFEAVAPTSAKRSTCPPSSPPASIRT